MGTLFRRYYVKFLTNKVASKKISARVVLAIPRGMRYRFD
jgi:hypothetical protein